mmetsp:Transcript_3809/g.4558  ORF Transcript_3809/g.4558 Transcript_3809/m.4558 type:complete len:104 (+) Transcript_3809:115-426(+)|eukprot:CAMPEP_0195252684 /NCGR_PEP_ID=MMETSP0706-20130129/4008_1 /TAXON_ID=33640 /ORGANISM="Asterionellopsis glacialis, Strain CCMP134" /LENGTH=103 /DNA_ID=CAMNT_0040305025 /DNA_START=106 /DNA_END=417 /DNA_ORIENTATION=-
MWKALQLTSEAFMRRFAVQSPSLQLAGVPLAQQHATPSLQEALQDALWFAVPKQKISRSKKRKKTTRQKAIKVKENIITDPRTGEPTLMHKLPFNWKKYLPEV